MAMYTERYVAFLDLLGFRDLVLRSLNQEAKITVDQIRSVLDHPDPAGKEQIVLGRIGDISDSGHRLTAFSDSVVITTDPTEQGLMHLLHHVEKIGFRLARLHTLYRGGITRGLAYHDERHVFGPAIIDAYELEKRAEVPRVLLSESVVAAGRSAAEPVKTVFGLFTHVDSDGEVFVHYLRILRMIANSDGPVPADVRALQAEIISFIAEELRRSESKPMERQKIEWFQNYFRWVIDDSWRDVLLTTLPSRP